MIILIVSNFIGRFFTVSKLRSVNTSIFYTCNIILIISSNDLIYGLYLGPELALNSHCEEQDVCADDNSACRNFTCLCKDGYFQKSSICSEYFRI